jgi:hypothetical protein
MSEPGQVGSSRRLKVARAEMADRARRRGDLAWTASQRAIAEATGEYAARGMAASGGAQTTAWRVGSESLRTALRSELEELTAGLSRREAKELLTIWLGLIAERFTDLRNNLAPRTGLEDRWRLLSVQAEDAAVDDLTQVLAARSANRRSRIQEHRFQLGLTVLGGIAVAVVASLVTHYLGW